MDPQLLVEVARLVSRQSTLLALMAGMMTLGLIILGWELYAITKGLQGIATLTAEVLRRTPEP
jgi:hypothetical protein